MILVLSGLFVACEKGPTISDFEEFILENNVWWDYACYPLGDEYKENEYFRKITFLPDNKCIAYFKGYTWEYDYSIRGYKKEWYELTLNLKYYVDCTNGLRVENYFKHSEGEFYDLCLVKESSSCLSGSCDYAGSCECVPGGDGRALYSNESPEDSMFL